MRCNDLIETTKNFVITPSATFVGKWTEGDNVMARNWLLTQVIQETGM